MSHQVILKFQYKSLHQKRVVNTYSCTDQPAIFSRYVFAAFICSQYMSMDKGLGRSLLQVVANLQALKAKQLKYCRRTLNLSESRVHMSMSHYDAQLI